MSRVILKDIWAENIFEWFYNSIIKDGGDGAAVICCGNPGNTSYRFIDWWKTKILPKMKEGGYRKNEFHHLRDSYVSTTGAYVVNYHDSNENFMFCDQVIDIGYHDISFIVEEACPSAYEEWIIEAIK